MSEPTTCPDCGRPKSGRLSDGLCFASGDANCELFCQLTEAKRELEARKDPTRLTTLCNDLAEAKRGLAAWEALADYGDGDTPTTTAAAIDLAVRLGVLEKT